MAILKALPWTKYSVRQNMYLPVIRYVPRLNLGYIRDTNYNYVICFHLGLARKLIKIWELDTEIQKLIEGKLL